MYLSDIFPSLSFWLYSCFCLSHPNYKQQGVKISYLLYSYTQHTGAWTTWSFFISMLNQTVARSRQRHLKNHLIQVSLSIPWTQGILCTRMWGPNVVNLMLNFSTSFPLKKLFLPGVRYPHRCSWFTMSDPQNTLILHSLLGCSIPHHTPFTAIQKMYFMFAFANDTARQSAN